MEIQLQKHQDKIKRTWVKIPLQLFYFKIKDTPMGCFSKVKNGIRSTAFTYFQTKNIFSSVCPKPTHFLLHHIGNDCCGSKPQLHLHFFYKYLDSENKKIFMQTLSKCSTASGWFWFPQLMLLPRTMGNKYNYYNTEISDH